MKDKDELIQTVFWFYDKDDEEPDTTYYTGSYLTSLRNDIIELEEFYDETFSKLEEK